MSITRIIERLINITLVVSLLTSLYPAQLYAQPMTALEHNSIVAAAAGTDQAITTIEPEILSHPVAIARAQSTYVSNSETVVTYRITNNQLPTLSPEIDEFATLTETTEILAGFVLTDDMNTLRNVTVALTLTNGTLVNSNSVSQNGNTLTWMLPDLAPQQTDIVSVTLSSPVSGGAFVELDDGAVVSAELWHNPITSQARPSVVIPDTVDPIYMVDTVDADIDDGDMLWVSAEFQQDPIAAFELVKSFGFDPYAGSLRGSRGTLWGEAGNSLDQSSLLIAILRAAGVPARYRHGSLSVADANALIDSRFDMPQGVAGYLPSGAELGSGDFTAIAQDHWWVEAYLPSNGDWTDLDPSYNNATIGDIFATPGTDDRIAEVPSGLRHTIKLALEVEQYTQFPVAGTNLQRFSPLEQTFSTVELAGRAVVFGQIVTTNALPGQVFASTEHTYAPYIKALDSDLATVGDEFSDILTNFPLATTATVGEWLTYEVTDSAGNVETFQRTVKDLLGPDVRFNGGAPDLAFSGSSEPFVQFGDLYVNWFLPHDVPSWALEKQQAHGLPKAIELSRDIVELKARVAQSDNGYLSEPNDVAFYKDLSANALVLNQFLHSVHGIEFAVNSDNELNQISRNLQSHSFYNAPRIFTIARADNPTTDTTEVTMDLRSTTAEVLVSPFQSTDAQLSVQWLKGVSESKLEGQAIAELTGLTPVTTYRVFEEMALQGIEPIFITPETRGTLSLYPFSPDAAANMTEALNRGQSILAPSAPVQIDGEPTFAWWEIDPSTGETISVGEDGLHTSSIQYVNAIKDLILAAMDANGTVQFIQQLESIGLNLRRIFLELADLGFGAGRSAGSSSWRYFPDHLCSHGSCGIEQFVTGEQGIEAIPLPETTFTYAYESSAETRTLNILTSSSGSSFSLGVAPNASTTAPNQTTNFNVSVTSTSVENVLSGVYAPEGWDVMLTAAGNVVVTPESGAEPGDYTVVVVVQSDSDPSLIDSAEHTVTITALEALEFGVTPEPNLTIPQNAALFAAAAGQTNDGEAEIPDSAYRIDVHNQSTASKIFTVNTTGAPAGWIILDGSEQNSTSFTLQAGAKTTLGLYVVPTTLPAPGTSQTINVTIDDGGLLNDNAQINWTMPGQAHNYMTVAPETLYVGANDIISFTVDMKNVGNVAGIFPVTATTPISSWVISPINDFTLVEGMGDEQTVNLTTANGEIGRIYPLQLSSPAPGTYTQYAFAEVVIVSPDAEALGVAGDVVAACSAESTLPAYFDAVFNTFNVLESACTGGSCDSQQRDDVVNATTQLTDFINTSNPGLDTSALESATAILAVASTVQENLDALPAVSSSVSALVEPVCAFAETQPALQWTPAYSATLTNQPISYTLDLTNNGTVTSTYALTVELPSGQFIDTPTVAPNAVESYQFALSSVTPDLIQVDATVVADTAPLSTDEASASLNVVDRFIQLTAVTASPNFVETGVSQSDISIEVANFANVPILADVNLTFSSDSGIISTATTPIIIRPGNPEPYDLTTLDTSGLATGVYTVTVDIVDSNGNPIDDGNGVTYIGVGQALGATHYVEPQVVSPGTVTVTTVISTAILVGTAASAGSTPTAPPLWEPTGVRAFDREQFLANIDENNQSAASTDSDPQPNQQTGDENLVENQSSIVTSAPAGYSRTEATSPTITYNGNWSNQTLIFSATSDEHASRSNTVGDSAVLNFIGTWVNVGLVTDRFNGSAEIFIDGNSQGIFDLYSRDVEVQDFAFGNLSSGSHTISITVASITHPNALNSYVSLDYIDVWDGTPLVGGTQEAELVALTGKRWVAMTNVVASGDSYLRGGTGGDAVWIPFEGDSIELQFIADRFLEPWVEVVVDGVAQPSLNLWHIEPTTRTFAFDGFGNGLHLLRLVGLRGNLTLDTTTTPATQPTYNPPSPSGVVRYEEHDLIYDGDDSWDQRSSNWSLQRDNDNVFTASGYSSYEAVRSGTAGDTASLTFEGSWVNIGFLQTNFSGSAEILIDNTLVQTILLDDSTTTIVETQFAVPSGTHTVTVRIVGDGNVTIDFIDIYDDSPVGNALVDPWFGDAHLQTNVHFSAANDGALTDNALGGRYMIDTINTWYTFVGDSVTFYAVSQSLDRNMKVYVDGQLVETVNLEYDFANSTFAFHYNDLGDGPHTIRVENDGTSQVDGFVSPATNEQLYPLVEWSDDAPQANALNCGMCTGIVSGDINNDGIAEIIFTSEKPTEERLYVYRGDGMDAGSGSPLIWDVSLGNVFNHAGSPAIGDLDPTYPGSEIAIMTEAEMRVYHADGSLWWSDDTIQMTRYIGAPALGNLDGDPEPEIVVNDRDRILVLDADGSELWSQTFDTTIGAPMLADMTGDGLLDIVISEYGQVSPFPADDAHIYLYDFNLGSPNLVWSYTLSTTLAAGFGLFGTHAVADIDGQQPGGDTNPELAISHDGYLTILNHDGTPVWSTTLESGDPGGVTVADVDGDGEVEIITGMKHEFEPGRFGKLYAVNADGSILWDIIAEDSTSANSASVLDLNGDGVYEVAWNGLEMGFNIFNGADGSVLYNDRSIFTRSGTDYPIIADVDGDDEAEIVIATQFSGVVVLGFGDQWGNARPIWNQQTYHITNVNDDLSIPVSEIDSWSTHNTYKTQTPEEFVLPIFGVNVSHTVGSDNLTVADFNVAPDVSANPNYEWNYVQTVASPTVTRTLDIVLSDLQPGETRLVAAGTTISYTLGSGQNTLQLPPLYVTVAKLITIEPFSQTVGAGSVAQFMVTLTNPSDVGLTYDLELPPFGQLATLVESVFVPANSTVDVPLTINTMEDEVGSFDFIVTVDDGNGGLDSANGQLIVIDALDLAIAPSPQNTLVGETRAYTLTVSNHLLTQETITLGVSGLPNVTAPTNVVVAGNSSTNVVVTAQGFVAGQLPFIVTGTNDDGATDSADGILDVVATQEVSVGLNPDPVDGGPAMPSIVTVTVTNEGATIETFDLDVAAPAGWQAELAEDEVTLAPFVFNSAEIQLILTPPVGTAPGNFSYTVSATARDLSRTTDQPAMSSAEGTVIVGARGVQISLDPVSRTAALTDTPTWNVTITNTGNVADTFVLTTTGIIALSASFSQPSVVLMAGESTTIQMTATDLTIALPQLYEFAVGAISQVNSAIRNEAKGELAILNGEAVNVSWFPETQEIDESETAYYLLTITNTGNLVTRYDLAASPLAGSVNLSLERGSLTIPAHTTAQVLVSATASQGMYQLMGSAESNAGTTAAAEATLIVRMPTAVSTINVHPPTAPPHVLLLTILLSLGSAFFMRRDRRR